MCTYTVLVAELQITSARRRWQPFEVTKLARVIYLLKAVARCDISVFLSFAVGAASAMGAKATKKLVKGGTLIPTEKTFRVYKKYGDLARALEDFESVKYTETLSFKTPNKVYGCFSDSLELVAH